MKTMTCKDIDGPCNVEIQGETAEEIMKKGYGHVYSTDDEEHKKTVGEWQAKPNDPEAKKKWMEDFQTKFDAAPEN